MHAGTCPIRAVAEAPWGSGDAHVQSTTTRRPRPQAVRARGTSRLPHRFSAKASPRTPWARGLLSAFWEWGSPDLPACGLRHGSGGGPARPIFISPSSRPSRGAKPCGADDRKLPQEWPHQAGSRGGGEINARVPREDPMTQAMTIKTRRALGGRRPTQGPCFPFGAKGASTGQDIRQRLPFRCNETKTSRTAGRRSPWSPRRRHHQCFWQSKTNFSQDKLY